MCQSHKRETHLYKLLLGGLLWMVSPYAVSQEALAVGNEGKDSEEERFEKRKSLPEHEVMVVIGRPLPLQAGSRHSVQAEELERKGANDFGSIMRYEPLIGATGSSGGSSNGKSGFDRSGYTGYNIRGLESNRVSLTVNGIPLPEATGRSYVARAGQGTFGIGRDYIDPYMYGAVDIKEGATAVESANTAIGGEVSFIPKTPDRYLAADKEHYFSYRSGYDSSNRSWHSGITAAAGDELLSGILIFSRRDGQQTRNASDSIDANPANWHSNALQSSVVWQPGEEHRLTGTVDYYDRITHSRFPTWRRDGSSVEGTANQQNTTRRWSLSLKEEWMPFNALIDTADLKAWYQQTQAHDNTLMPALRMSPGQPLTWERVYSSYNVNTWGTELALNKTLANHTLSSGFNARMTETQRPFRQEPSPRIGGIMQPEADSKTRTLGGYMKDEIVFNSGGNQFTVIPAGRLVYQRSEAQNAADLANAALSVADAKRMFDGKNSDTQFLPSLSLEYNIAPGLMTYLEYRRGAQFPNASQLYGSWNLTANFAGPAQYALLGNANLQTETSNEVEWGLRGELLDGLITLRGALFYNDYKNFIAYSRYTRRGSPEKFARVPGNIYTVYQSENRDKAYIYGGSLTATLDVGRWAPSVKGLSVTAAYGYSEGKSKSSYQGDKYVDLDSVAPMKAVLGLAWDDPDKRYGMALISTFVKGKQASATNRESYANTGSPLKESSQQYMRISGYGLVDATAYWQVAKGVRINSGVYNIGDRKYRDYLSSRDLMENTPQDTYNKALAVMPGRTWQVGVSLEF